MDTNLNNVIAGILAYLQKHVPQEKQAEVLTGLSKIFREEKTKVYITSAVDLNTDEKEKLEKYLKLKADFSKVEYSIDKSIIGGLKIKIGDNLIDRSISTKINQVIEI